MQDHNMLILAALIGFVSGLASTAFRWMIEFFGNVFSSEGLSLLGITGTALPFLLPLMPMFGGIFTGIICHFFPDAVKENGVHRVMHAVALKAGKIRKRTLITCSTTSALTIGSGGSAGREGPTVQIGSAVGSALGNLFHLSRERVRVLVGCGAAAGIAASFNAPLAGVLFSLEIILGDFAIHTFSPIIVASVIGTATGRALEGNEITFQVPIHELVSYSEIIFYLFLGLLCGLVSRLFTSFYFKSHDFFDNKVNLPKPLKPALGGLIVGLISIGFPAILGNGYEFMEKALSGELLWGMAFILIFLKIFSTSVTLGSGGLGGVFAPSLFIGAMLGSAFGAMVHGINPDLTASPETYALVGMGAVAGAVMQAPLTNILMLFELTNDYTIILPIMITCIVSAQTFRGFTKNSIYIQKLLKEGINIQHGREVSILNSIKVSEVMHKEVTNIPEGMPFRKILETISYSKNFYFPVVNDKGEMSGILSFHMVREMIFEEDLGDLVVANDLSVKPVKSLTPDNNLNQAMELFAQLDVEQLPVVHNNDIKRVIGMVNRGEVVAAYNREVLVSGFDR
ncbi:MAG: chloride channel protein [Nitrospinae bacterium]|nr:chloride channel protein [Nitrospinota bacterium]MZH03771.1 chloride channel protein [Nitrospinota bacterium]MZH15451.1 chloride channel protein [Nitrospinota bacterium]